MNTVVRGGIAGLIATIVLSLLMMMKAKIGLMPELDIISMLASKMGGEAMMGWVAHFMIGIVAYGIGFSIIHNMLPGKSLLVKGIILGVIGWLMMMLVIMPMMGAGLFAMEMGMMAPVMTLMLHLIFGAVLGLSYKMLSQNQ
jgi:uncharacterized membrane protein YagU involved in acid resistance